MVSKQAGHILKSALLAMLLSLSSAWAGEIAITFDDAPTGDSALMSGTDRTSRLIAALSDAGVTEAMIFVSTGNITGEAEAARLRAYTEAGHVLANHSHTHPWLRETEPDVYLADLDQAAGILSGFENTAPFFRFPYLDEGNDAETSNRVRQGLETRGLANGYVTVDNYDWFMQALLNEAFEAGHNVDLERLGRVYVEVLLEGVRFYDAVAQQELGRSPRHVLLLHENDLAALFLPDLVAALRADGWEIIPARAAYEDPIAGMVPETLFNGQGRVAAIAHANGMSPRGLVSPMEEEDVLRGLFLEHGLLPDPPDPE